MEAQWQADRAALRELLHTRPDLTLEDMAHRLHRSYGWAKKWAKRLAAAPPDDLTVLVSRSRCALHAAAGVGCAGQEPHRTDPPPAAEGLQRTPGPKAIAYYLPRDAELQAASRLPPSPLDQNYLAVAHPSGTARQNPSTSRRKNRLTSHWKRSGRF